MSKVLKTVATIAAVVAIAATIAIPFVGPAIAATLATVASVASAVAAAATVGAQALQKPPDMKGTVNEVVIGSNMPVPYVMGRTFVGGMKVYDNVAPGPNGHPNKDRTHIFVGTHAGPIDSFEKFQADYTPITFASETGGLISGVASGYYGADGGYLWLNTRKGLRPDTALTAPAGRAAITGWTSAHKLSGMACWSATMEFDEEGERWSSGIPAFGMVAKWVWAYDPRLDSTYSGGSGPQRWSDESTWAWTENPALHAMTYVRGRFMNGIKVVGAGIPQNAVNIPAFVELANICDANAWKVGGAVYEGPGFSRWDNLKRILQAASAEPVWVGGLLSCRFSSPKTTLVQINSDDLADGDIEVQAMSNFKDRHNTLVPRYRSEPHKWEYVQADAVQNTTYLAEDGETKTDEVQYDLVQNKDQAAQLAAYELANRREFGPIRITCKNHLRTFKPGEAVTLNISEAGLVSQLAVITSRTVDPSTGSVQFELVSETTAKHAYALGKTGVAPATPTIIAPQDVDAAVGGFDADVTGSQTAVGDGNRVRFSLFESGMKGWMTSENTVPVIPTTAITPSGGITYLQATGSFTANSQQMGLGTDTSTLAVLSANKFPVTAGERVFAGAIISISANFPSAGNWFLMLGYLNSNNTEVGLTRDFIASGSGSLVSAPRVGDFLTVPVGAVAAFLRFEIFNNSGGAVSNVNFNLAQPMVSSAGATQTVWPNFTPGPGSEAGADITSNNAAIGDGNRVRFSLFENGTAGFGVIDNSASLPVTFSAATDPTTGKRVLQAVGTFTAAGQTVSIGSLGSGAADSAFRFPVDGQKPERIYVECKEGVSAPAGATWYLAVGFVNAAGGVVSEPSVVGTFSGAGINTFPLPQGNFVPVPAGAVGGWVEMYVTSGGSGAFTIWFSEPMVTSAAAGQTTHPNFVPGPSSEPGASVTTNIAVQNPITIAADSAGVPKSGQLRTIALKLMRSGVALTSGVTWAATTLSGTATYTISGTGTGTLTLTGPNNATLSPESVIRITATYLGATSTYDTKITRNDDPPTNAGSTGGGGSNPGTTGNTTSFDIISTTSYSTVQGSAIVSAKAGTAGRVDCTFPGYFTRTLGTSNGQTALAGKIQWRVVGGTFADLPAGSQASTDNAKTLQPAGDPPDNQDGSISVTDALTGKTAGTLFEFRVVFFKTNVSGAANNVVPGGVFQCVGS